MRRGAKATCQGSETKLALDLFQGNSPASNTLTPTRELYASGRGLPARQTGQELPRGVIVCRNDKEGTVYARIASFEGGSTEKMRELNEERMSAGTMEMPPGMQRAILLSDEGGTRRMFISFFESREAIAAAEEGFDKMGDDVPEDIRGRRTSVEVYEVVFEGP